MFRRRFVGNVTAGLRAITPARHRWCIWIWAIGGMVMVMVVAGLLIALQTVTINAADEPDAPLDCLSCHPRTLKSHDKLGTGNNACWVCHDSTDMKAFHLADGTRLSLSDSSQLCAQCHPGRYNAWKEGTHGTPGAVATPECAYCHDPHQPRIALLDITRPHPPPAPSPSPPATALFVMLGTSLLLAIVVGVAVATKGELP